MNWTVIAAHKEDGRRHVVTVVHNNGDVLAYRTGADGDDPYFQELPLSQQHKTDIFNIWKPTIIRALSAGHPEFHPKVLGGVLGDMPSPGQPGGEERFYISTDERAWYRDNGSSWELMFGADALAGDSSQRSLGTGTQEAAAGDHTHY